MSENVNKGPLIQRKQKSNTLERPKPVLVNKQNDFKFKNEEQKSILPVINEPVKKEETPSPIQSEKKVVVSDTERKKNIPLKRKSVVGKNNNVKSIKVPNELHTQIGILGKFMDENRTYAILSELVKYYAANELTDRQQKQFDYMTEFFNESEE